MNGINCARNPMNDFNLNESKVRQLSPNVSAVDFVKDAKGNFKTCETPTGKADKFIEKALKTDPNGERVILMNQLSIDPITKKIPDAHVYLPFVD
jgi:hypothetical protein